MTTTCPSVPSLGSRAGSRSTPPKGYQLQHAMSQPQSPRRLWSSTMVSSLSTCAASASSSSSCLRCSRGGLSLLQLHLPGRKYPRSPVRSSSLSTSPPPPARDLQTSSSKRINLGKLMAVSASSASRSTPATESEEVFFDGGVHFGDLLVNLVFGLTLAWLPLTLTAVFRNLFLRYRFTNLRVTVQSGLLGGDRKDFSYDVVKEVKAVPRFIGEWGDMAIELNDGTIVDIRCVPKFREIAKYIEERAVGTKQAAGTVSSSRAKGGGTPKKGFS